MRRAARIFAWAVLSLATLAAALLVGGLLAGRSEWGRRKVLALAQPPLASRLDGSLSIGGVEGDLTRRLVLHDVEVRDREGQVALRARRIALRYQLGALLHRAVRLEEVDAEGVWVHARPLADGRNNLATLLKPSAPSAEPPYTVDVARARIDGDLRLDDPRHPVQGHLHVEGSAQVQPDRNHVTIDALAIEARAPLAARGAARGEVEWTERGATLRRSSLSVQADGNQLRRLLPDAELQGPWRAALEAEGPLERLAVSLQLQPPRGRLSAHAILGVAAGGLSWQGRVEGAQIDPGAAWRGAPHGTLSLAASGAGRGGVGEVTLERLLLDAAGTRAQARGSLRVGPHPAVDGWLDLEARDLSRLAALGLPGLSGELVAHGHVQHDAAHTHIDADVHARALGVAAARIRHLDARVHSLDLVGSAQLTARGIQAGGARIDALTLAASGDRRALALQLDARGRELQAHLAAHGAPIERRGHPLGADLTVDELSLALRGQRWRAVRPAHVRVDAALRVAGLVLQSGAQRLALDGSYQAGRIDLQLDGAALDAAELLALAGRHPTLPHSQLDVRAHLYGRSDDPTADLELSGESAPDPQLGFDRAKLRLRAHYQSARVRGEISAQATDHDLGARFDLPTRLQAAQPLALEMDAHTKRISEWRRFLPAQLQLLEGEATLHARVGGTAAHPRLQARVDGAALRLDELERSQVTVEAHYQDATLNLDARTSLRTAHGPAGHLTAQVTIPVDLGRGLKQPTLFERLVHDTPIAATVHLESLDVAHLPYHARLPLRAGVLDGQIQVRGTLHEPELQLELAGRGLAAAGVTAVDARARLRYARAEAQLELSADLRGAPLLTLTGRARVPFQQIVDRQRWQDAPLSIDATVLPYDLAHFRSFAGRLSGALHLSGTIAAPRGQAQLAVEQLRVSESRFTRVEARGGFDGERATAWARIEQPSGGALQLDATVPRGRDAPWSVVLAARALTIDVRPGATDFIRTLKGVVNSEVTVGGTRARPTVAGTLRVDGGAIALPGDPRLYENLQVDLAVRDGDLALNRLAVKVYGGSVVVTGHGKLDGLQPVRFDATATSEHFPLVAGGLDAYVDTTLDVHAERAGSRTVAGRITVKKGTLHLPRIQTKKQLQSTGPLADVVFTDEAARAEAAARSKAERGGAPFRAQLAAQIPGPFHVRSKEVNAELKGELGIDLAGPLLKVSGHVEALGGWVELLGRRYRLERVRLGFDGSPKIDPELDIRLTRDITDTVIVIELHGTARNPQLVLSSEPPIYDQSQLLGIIVSGDPGTSRVSDRSLDQRVVGALSGVIVGKLKDQIAPSLPIDVIRVDVGATGYTGYDQTRVEVGKYLTENIYVSYVHQFGQAPTGTRRMNSNQAQVEYRFKRRYELDTMFGDAGVGSIDLFWTIRY